MDTLIFATNNLHKVQEIRAVLGNRFSVVTLQEAGINTDIPEPHDTLEANAIEKSSVIGRLTGKDCFGEDTGLETEILNGEPGVKSARYAGADRSFDANIDKLLHLMEDQTNRRARFRTVISLLLNGRSFLFEGICEGHITTERAGTNGFGYDPVFVPAGASKTFAEMTLEEKNQYSHRKKAVEQLVQFLLQKAENQ